MKRGGKEEQEIIEHNKIMKQKIAQDKTDVKKVSTLVFSSFNNTTLKTMRLDCKKPNENNDLKISNTASN